MLRRQKFLPFLLLTSLEQLHLLLLLLLQFRFVDLSPLEDVELDFASPVLLLIEIIRQEFLLFIDHLPDLQSINDFRMFERILR